MIQLFTSALAHALDSLCLIRRVPTRFLSPLTSKVRSRPQVSLVRNVALSDLWRSFTDVHYSDIGTGKAPLFLNSSSPFGSCNCFTTQLIPRCSDFGTRFNHGFGSCFG